MSENSKILEVNLNNDDSYNVFDGYSYIENLYIHDVKDINKFVKLLKKQIMKLHHMVGDGLIIKMFPKHKKKRI